MFKTCCLHMKHLHPTIQEIIQDLMGSKSKPRKKRLEAENIKMPTFCRIICKLRIDGTRNRGKRGIAFTVRIFIYMLKVKT